MLSAFPTRPYLPSEVIAGSDPGLLPTVIKPRNMKGSWVKSITAMSPFVAILVTIASVPVGDIVINKQNELILIVYSVLYRPDSKLTIYTLPSP